jgi:RNA polymerase sigma factor (sigma-70 family)
VEARTATAPAWVRPSLRHLLGRNTPLLRLQSDESLVALTRAGNRDAFEVLVRRYRPRILTFCGHMLGTTAGRDAEDVVQEVLVAAYTAMVADERPIEVRPWLYRIARNRALNHLRGGASVRPANGDGAAEALERKLADGGLSAAEQANRREDLRRLVADLRSLPESQRSAIVLRELEAMSYKQVAEVMDTTVPSVKSLLVRARLALVEIAEGREIPCAEVRFALAHQEEGLRSLDPAERAHLKRCPDCASARKRLKATTNGLAALTPWMPLAFLGRLLPSKLGGAAGGGAAGGGSIATGGLTAGGGALATKAAVVTLFAVTVFAGALPHAHSPAPPAGSSAGATAIDRPAATVVPDTTASARGPSAAAGAAANPAASATPPPAAGPPVTVTPASSAGGPVAAASVSPDPAATDPGAATSPRGRPSPPTSGSTARGRPSPDPIATAPPTTTPVDPAPPVVDPAPPANPAPPTSDPAPPTGG